MPLLQIGPVVFETTGPHLDKLKHHVKGWVAQKRFGRADARQWTGVDGESIEVSGTIWTDYYDGFGALGQLRALQPHPQMVVSGAGDVFGLWCIIEVGNEQTLQYPDGTPRRVGYDLKLAPYGEDAWSGLGALAGPVGSAIGAAAAFASVRLF